MTLIELTTAELHHVTGGDDFPRPPTLSELGGGPTLGPPPEHILQVGRPRQPFEPLPLPGGRVATFGR
jgi:hypothetical protein